MSLIRRNKGCLVAAFILVILVVAGWRSCSASFFAWELDTRTPTLETRASKALGIFDRYLQIENKDFALGETMYHVQEAWLEHRIEARKVNPFKTEKVIYPELVLCMRVAGTRNGESIIPQLKIKDAKMRRFLVPGRIEVLCKVVGKSAPRSVVVMDWKTKEEARIHFAQSH